MGWVMGWGVGLWGYGMSYGVGCGAVGLWGGMWGYGVGYGVRARVGAMGRVYEGRTLLWGAVGQINELTARGRCGADLWGDR